jgi:NGFI-A-binding protein
LDFIDKNSDQKSFDSGPLGVQIISSSGGNIIAVANPALALSPTFSDTINVKREVTSPEI